MKIYFTEQFKHQLKQLSKKHPHAKEDLLTRLENIKLDNEIHIGKSIYKVRIQSSDQQKGKSGGFRSYIYFYLRKDLLIPLCIYAKNIRENMSENELQYYFDKTIEELIF